MPGNDLTATRNLIPTASTRQDQARADITTILTNIVNDIEPKVTPAGLDISSALSFLSGGVYSPATDLGYLSFENRSTSSGVAGSIYEQGGELYYRDASGQNVQITSGGVLNAASLGGITGAGYGASGRELNWDGSRYNFYDGAGTYGDVRMRNLEIEDGNGDTVTVDCPNLVSSYTLSLPPGAPSAAQLLQADTSGNVTFSSTLAEDLTLTGGAELKHGDRVLTLSPAAGQSAWGYDTTEPNLDGTGSFWNATGAGEKLLFPVSLRVGDRIKSIRYVIDKGDTSAAGITLYKQDLTGSPPAESEHESWATSTSGVNDTTETLSSAYTILADEVVWLMIDLANASDEFYGFQVTYDRP
jgi:hypothetical protein